MNRKDIAQYKGKYVVVQTLSPTEPAGYVGKVERISSRTMTLYPASTFITTRALSNFETDASSIKNRVSEDKTRISIDLEHVVSIIAPKQR